MVRRPAAGTEPTLIAGSTRGPGPPEGDGAAMVGGGQGVAIGAERHGVDAGLAVLQTKQLLPGDQVPEPDGFIVASGCQGRSIGGNGGAANRGGVLQDGQEPPPRGARAGIPSSGRVMREPTGSPVARGLLAPPAGRAAISPAAPEAAWPIRPHSWDRTPRSRPPGTGCGRERTSSHSRSGAPRRRRLRVR